jgi:1,4-alpha-glucan branching enzyme
LAANLAAVAESQKGQCSVKRIFQFKTMKSFSIQPVSERFPALEEQEMILTFLAPEARQVNVAGHFNGWRPDVTPLKNTGAGKWVVRLMLRSGQYEYRFVVDGCWSEDPRASQRVANLYGGFNSVLLVPLAVKTSIL